MQPITYPLLRVEESRKKVFYHLFHEAITRTQAPKLPTETLCFGKIPRKNSPPLKPTVFGVHQDEQPLQESLTGGSEFQHMLISASWSSLSETTGDSFQESRCGGRGPQRKHQAQNLCLSQATCSQLLLGCTDINLWDHMSETFHHWGTAERSWWCFMSFMLGVRSMARIGPCFWAHGTVRRKACTSFYF